MIRHRFIVAAAGSGKTTFLVNEALNLDVDRALITTYTQANETEIKRKLVRARGCIPDNITVRTWFSFLLQHGVRPFQGCLWQPDIKGILLVNSQSGVKFYSRGKPVYYSEDKEFGHHYFTRDQKIYTDKIAKFALRCDQSSGGAVIDRLSRIYSHIFVDEVQDLAGYDLDILDLLLDSTSTLLLVGDPRQGTYSTNAAPKNKKYRKANIVSFFQPDSSRIQVDSTSLKINHRCVDPICQLSNRLYPDLEPTSSGNASRTGHDGVFIVRSVDLDRYLEQYHPVQLRDSSKTAVRLRYQVMNFGQSKGLSFDRVLIYPTDPITSWLADDRFELAATSRAKFYVAITRARQSVAIVSDSQRAKVDGAQVFC